ncbi:ATP phosphoribosyltransferase [Candidatus Desulforudis audaxviator]|uniref:ATP phosphoribosyltransferase n=1 Tax=Desulforudis audaxviator (strain MP104C) TaxID=477974 RepID=HIS1_DESAP|nr:ATP phosphoribosyltransferase [Candidatus Desulforudis audaxviator]B1I190.1 RecName: Full=ATP phosphoribosyltransferase; Short=ATP-PRT; Short=ATP-PRTase [Candidatus Desulforudis audaxviator MP104C]ACA58651.1 ATP phosphoribosyltransferase [Candidatus Desulforudis audaxviator MP104C]AZK58651.1 ATP phosphoribosyltransferase [Candidatus Desulforudis audaxviator]
MKLRLGLPKGSLQEKTFQLFKKAGYDLQVNSRSYYPAVNDPELEILLMRAQEIPRYVHEGVLDAGLSGLDWIMENEADVVEVADLIYSKRSQRPVRLVLAVANDSDIREVRDLQGKRIATELVNVTRRYLAAQGVEAIVEYSYGATEVKVPNLVDAIADLTETGSSLRANNLRILAVILESNTKLHANRAAWADPWKREKLLNLTVLLTGALRAENMVGLKMNVPGDRIDAVLGVLPAMKHPTVSQLFNSDWVAIETILNEQQVRDLIPILKRAGAQDIIEYPLNKVIP